MTSSKGAITTPSPYSWRFRCGRFNSLTTIKSSKLTCERKPFCWKTYQHGTDELITGYCKEDIPYVFPMYLAEIVKQYYIIIILPTNKVKMPNVTEPKEGIYILHFKIQNKKRHCRSITDVQIGLKEINDDKNINSFLLFDYFSGKGEKYDIITMELDYVKGNLSFAINKEWFGSFSTINREKKYKFYYKSQRSRIKLIQMKIIPRQRKKDKKSISTEEIIAMADEIDNVSTDKIKEALLSNDDTVKDTMIMTLLATLEELYNSK